MRGGGIESLPAGAVVVHVGSEGFVMPWAEFRATPAQLARLEVAGMLAEAEGLAGVGRMLLGQIETEMAREAKRRARTPPEGRGVRAPAGLELIDWPLALRSGKDLGLPVVDTPQGRVYAPDPHRPGYDANKAPVMAKFDRVAAVQPPPALLDMATMSEDQGRLLARAEEALKSANQRRDARARVDPKTDEILGYGRVTQAERDERRFARDAYSQLGLGTLDKRDRDEVRRGRAESFALAAARGRLERREACKAVRAQYAEHRSPYSWHSPRRRGAIARELLELRKTLREEAKAAVLADVRSGGRRLTRGGLEGLLGSGAIDRAEFTAGEKYAQIYDKARPRLKIANMEGSGVGGGAVGDDVERARRLRELAAKQALTELEAHVQAHVKSPRGITVLRRTAGEGQTVSSYSKGSSRSKNVEALGLALGALAVKWGLK